MQRGRLGIAGWIALAIAALIMVAPLAWTLLLSLKNNAELVGHSEAALHGPYTLQNYGAIFGNSLTLRWLLNSTIVALGQTAGVLVLASLAGYGFSRLDFPLRKPLFIFVLVGLAIPSQAVILVQHQLFAWAHLHNSYPGLILPGLVAPFRITFLGAWNDYWWPLISATHSNMYTLTVGLAAAQMNYAQTSGLGYLMAQAVFASIPIFIVYIVFQKQIVRAMAGTAVR